MAVIVHRETPQIGYTISTMRLLKKGLLSKLVSQEKWLSNDTNEKIWKCKAGENFHGTWLNPTTLWSSNENQSISHDAY